MGRKIILLHLTYWMWFRFWNDPSCLNSSSFNCLQVFSSELSVQTSINISDLESFENMIWYLFQITFGNVYAEFHWKWYYFFLSYISLVCPIPNIDKLDFLIKFVSVSLLHWKTTNISFILNTFCLKNILRYTITTIPPKITHFMHSFTQLSVTLVNVIKFIMANTSLTIRLTHI